MSDTQKRQRVEGTLHRVLPATITIRSATPDAEGSAPMAEPFTYDASNVEKFAKFF